MTSRGPQFFWTNGFLRVDFVVVVSEFVFWVLLLRGSGAKESATSSWNVSLTSCRTQGLRVLRACRVLRSMYYFRSSVSLFGHIINAMSRYIVYFFCVIYFFACVGVLAFADGTKDINLVG